MARAGAALAVGLMLALVVAVVAWLRPDQEATPSPATAAQTEPEHQDDDHGHDQPERLTVLALDDVDDADPQALAGAWGCSWWAHPRGQDATRFTTRMSPLATPEMAQAIASVRVPDHGHDQVIVQPGAVVDLGDDLYEVHCAILQLGIDATVARPLKPVTTTVELSPTGDGHWRVSGATIGGLSLP